MKCPFCKSEMQNKGYKTRDHMSIVNNKSKIVQIKCETFVCPKDCTAIDSFKGETNESTP